MMMIDKTSSDGFEQCKNKPIIYDKTTIAINRSTKKSLAELGSKGKSYEEIIKFLLKEWSETH